MPDALRARLGDAGFTPGARHFAELFALLDGDADTAELAEKALARAGVAVVAPIAERLVGVTGVGRSRLTAVLGRIAATGDATASGRLRGLLDDDDPRTRRAAVRWLGKSSSPDVEDALLARWAAEDRVEVQRALAEALGRAGSARSAEALQAHATTDPELGRLIANALTVLTREASRGEPSSIVADVAPAAPLPVVLHCRVGLEEILVSELEGFSPKNVAPGVVAATLAGPLSSLHVARTWLSFGVRIPAVPVRGEASDAIASAITSKLARETFRRFTQGAVRFRLAFPDGAHHRALAWSVARAVRERAPELINDPTASTWEVLVTEHEKVARIELSPRALPDPRFAYRVRDVAASSHPTIAAALARLGGVRDDDIVWDPFCGAGLELIERARLGTFKLLVGSDLEPRALEATRANLASADVKARLAEGDARTYRVPGVSLILTNPPMGRRVGNKAELGPLLDDALASFAAQLVTGGRLVWVSPMAGIARFAERLGMRVDLRRDLDMGGFTAQIQVCTKL